ncbi:MAG: amidohydrolase family protein [Candidatus Lambdaproteobacteria bacterium]|nr:amidohydrolase family protein [Candidatus Lambdaproteobacteria bacterium]
MAKIWAYFHQHNWPTSYETDQARRLEWMRRNGVRRFTTLNYAHRPGMAAWLNDWTADFAAQTPEAIPFGTFFPEPGAGDYVRRAIEEYGFRGFKLHVRVGRMALTDPLLAPALEQLAAAGLPLIVHIGSAPEGSEFTAPRFLHGMLAAHPRLKVVVAHMGAWEFAEYLKLAEERDTVFLDTTMVFVGFNACDPFPLALLPRLEAISHKVLFGSDYPIIPYPYAHAVDGILDLRIGADARRRMLGGNAARLLGL